MAAALTWRQRFPALTYRNYRLWLVARWSWALGMGLQGSTSTFLAYELTHSAAFVGSVAFTFGLPVLLLSVYGGVVADRFDRRRLVVALQVCWLIPASFLALMTGLHLIQPWHLIVYGLGIGTIHAFDNPARFSFMPSLVARDDLANASMLNQLVSSVTQAATPAIAGLVYARFGPTPCFMLSVFGFLPAVGSYLLIKVTTAQEGRPRASAASQIIEGLRYALTQPAERSLLILIGLSTMFGLATAVLLPAWAVKIMHGNAATNGLLNSAQAAGTVLSVTAIALLGRFNFKGKLLTVATFALPIMWLIFSQMRWLPLSVVVLLGVGAFGSPIVMLSMVLLQILVPDALRGRLMGITNLVNVGMQSIGSLSIGVIAQALGEPNAMVLAAAVLLATACAVYLFSPGLRRLE